MISLNDEIVLTKNSYSGAIVIMAPSCNILSVSLVFFVHRAGFEEERIDAILHRIEISQKHQSSNFGLNLIAVS